MVQTRKYSFVFVKLLLFLVFSPLKSITYFCIFFKNLCIIEFHSSLRTWGSFPVDVYQWQKARYTRGMCVMLLRPICAHIWFVFIWYLFFFMGSSEKETCVNPGARIKLLKIKTIFQRCISLNLLQ